MNKAKSVDLDFIFNNTQNLLLDVDNEGIIRHANKAVISIFGLKKNELIGKPVHSLLGEDSQPLKFTDNTIIKHRLKNGAFISILWSVTMKKESSGIQNRYYMGSVMPNENGVLFDFSAFFNRLSCSVLCCKASINGNKSIKDFVITELNPQAEKSLNVFSSNVLGESVFSCFPFLFDNNNLRELMVETALKGLAHEKNVFEPGKQRCYRLKIFSVQKHHIGLVFDDITDMKNNMDAVSELADAKKVSDSEKEKLIQKMQELLENERLAKERTAMAFAVAEQTRQELEISNIRLTEMLKKSEENNQLNRELLSVIAHEIRTPLSGIFGFSEVLSNDIKAADISHELKSRFSTVNFIKAASKKLSELLDNLMELSSYKSGKIINLHLEECSIKKTVEDVFILLRDRFETQNTVFHYHIYTDDIIKTDPLRFQQIILNLVNNAVKFTSNGKVEFFAHKDNNALIFKVADTGIGIQPEFHDKIFNIFEQLDVLKNMKYRGAGIGLSITKQFVEMLGGNISVESQVGKGSCFTFILPENPAVFEPLKKVEKRNPVPEKHSSLRVLFAEDDEINHAYLKQLLLSFHPQICKGVYNGKTLIQEIEESHNYNFVFLDIQLPEIDGVECLKVIKKINPGIPVIAITAYALSGDRNKFMKIGFDGFISKPVTKTDLISLMSSLHKKI